MSLRAEIQRLERAVLSENDGVRPLVTCCERPDGLLEGVILMPGKSPKPFLCREEELPAYLEPGITVTNSDVNPRELSAYLESGDGCSLQPQKT